jgi:small subunit ribosomal protein S18
MARSNQRGGTTSRRAPKDLGRRIKKKPCALCRDKTEWVDYKDIPMLRKYMSDRGKIRSRRVTGNCAQHQRALAQAIKTARELVLLPYTQRTVTERPGGRGRDRDRGERTLGETQGERGDRADRGARAARVEDVSVEVIDNTDVLGDTETEDAVAEEVGVLLEELVEDAVASEATNGAGATGAGAAGTGTAGSPDAAGDEGGAA